MSERHMDNAEAFDLLGETVAMNVARTMVGEPLLDIMHSDITEALASLDDPADDFTLGARFGYQTAGRKIAGLFADDELLVDPIDPEPSLICDTVVSDIGRYAVFEARRIAGAFHKQTEYDNTGAPFALRAKGLATALQKITRYTGLTIEHTALSIFYTNRYPAQKIVPLLYVAVTQTRPETLSERFGLVYGKNLTERLHEEKLLQIVEQHDRPRLEVSPTGVEFLKSQLPVRNLLV